MYVRINRGMRKHGGIQSTFMELFRFLLATTILACDSMGTMWHSVRAYYPSNATFCFCLTYLTNTQCYIYSTIQFVGISADPLDPLDSKSRAPLNHSSCEVESPSYKHNPAHQYHCEATWLHAGRVSPTNTAAMAPSAFSWSELSLQICTTKSKYEKGSAC
jgi:hypothetical protein